MHDSVYPLSTHNLRAQASHLFEIFQKSVYGVAILFIKDDKAVPFECEIFDGEIKDFVHL